METERSQGQNNESKKKDQRLAVANEREKMLTAQREGAGDKETVRRENISSGSLQRQKGNSPIDVLRGGRKREIKHE